MLTVCSYRQPVTSQALI